MINLKGLAWGTRRRSAFLIPAVEKSCDRDYWHSVDKLWLSFDDIKLIPVTGIKRKALF